MESPDASSIRIITTLGHVDHGKTTLMDALLASNNIISPRMAGKMRYLDSREDEQERGITMESSAVSLKFQVKEKGDGNYGGKSPNLKTKTYIVNMIDTPGHVDFSSEVSTASRLCDGALVLVDAVEGVCTQTIAVLRQSWHDSLKPILIINKIDRLITELKLAPLEAYHHLVRLIEQVNAVMGDLFAGDRMEDDWRWRESKEKKKAEEVSAGDETSDVDKADPTDGEEFQEKDDEDIYFSPDRGNVIFASALDGWGFRISKFAQLYALKLGMKEANLRKCLWGEYYLDSKTKRVLSYRHLKGRSTLKMKPLFVQFILENLWRVYEDVLGSSNPDKIQKILTSLSLSLPPRDLKSKDSRHLLSLILSQWLPLSTCIIQSVIDIVPPPNVAQATRIPKMLYPDLRELDQKPKNKVEDDLFKASVGDEAGVVAYVSKMFVVKREDLPENRKKGMSKEEMLKRGREIRERAARLGDGVEKQGGSEAGTDGTPSATVTRDATPIPTETEETTEPANGQTAPSEVALGFARLYSGTLRLNQSIYIVLPKFNASLLPSHPSNMKYLLTTKVEALYIMMGRELVPVQEVKAGNIFAVRGLEGKVGRWGTLCAPPGGVTELAEESEEVGRDCLINLGAVNRAASPIVRVALEPNSPADMPKLIEGLKLLVQSDPCVEMFQQKTGEWVILTAGELHLERCLKDLRERFAKVEIQASKPIVPFKETAIKAPDMAPTKTPNAPRGTIRAQSSQQVVSFTIRARPMHPKILKFVLDNLSTLKTIQHKHLLAQGRETSNVNAANSNNERDNHEDTELGEANEVDKYGDLTRKPTVSPNEFWEVLKGVCKEAGSEWEDLADKIWAFGPQKAGGCLLVDARGSKGASLRHTLQRTNSDHDSTEVEKTIKDFDNHIETGFQLATFQGPLCAEPVEGVVYFVEEVSVDEEALGREMGQNRMSQVTGSLISAVRDACRNGLLDWSPRLMLAMYSCEIQASTDVLGKVYGVVAKRRGRIVAEEMKEGTSFFNVSALLPVVESFGFADDIRTRTSGAASPQLIFSGYELLDLDPFWVPKTEEELEDLGEKADRSNIAKGYMDTVRERKGMFVDRKIVEFAEKQRTLKR